MVRTPTTSPGPRPGAHALLVLCLAVFAALVWRADFLIDDAYISFRYARNWSEFGVPAFNPGTSPPVEGFSNFLWVVFLRVAAGLGLQLELFARTLSVAFALGTLLLLHLHLCRLGLGTVATFLGTLSLASSAPFAVWATGGLETACFGFFALATYLALVRPTPNEHMGLGLFAGLLALVVALARVEGFLWVPAIAGCAWLNLRLGGDSRPSAGRFKRFFAVYLVGFGVFLLWRHATFGSWLANTAQAKGSVDPAVVLRGLKTSAMYLLLLPAVTGALCAAPAALRGPQRGAALGAAGMLTAFLGYNTLVGGDWMPFFRFLAPAAPFAALLLALTLDRMPKVPALALGLALIGFSALPLYDRSVIPRSTLEKLNFRTFQTGYQSEWQRWRTGVRNLASFRKLGRALKQIAGPEDSLTFGAIGAVGYESHLWIHDRNGLVDREVARSAVSNTRSAGHDKRVPRSFFLERSPTLLHAFLLEGEVGTEESETWQRARAVALQNIVLKVFRQTEGEQPLRSSCLPEAHTIAPAPWLPTGGLLMVLRATDDGPRARAYWDRVLGPVNSASGN